MHLLRAPSLRIIQTLRSSTCGRGRPGVGESTEGLVARSQFTVEGVAESYGHHVVPGVHLSLRPCRQSAAPAMLVRSVRVTCASICLVIPSRFLPSYDSSIDPLIRQLRPSV